ncbi:MAG TPA: bifunctional 3-(3-hydroxy-phenyl)propionate/3-hydroxycinnamic acid hydroxylase [Actinomycetes bacterium]|nr:bifunctional 3-(3-hydroxy-phenyl)propionate/3-hydroxycinnamic acid hydroxylase [Actinomycetes bacterium]
MADAALPGPADRSLDADVVVVGFGPVGQTLAALLGRRGHRVLVLERQDEPYPLPRAVVLDSEVMRVLSAAGVGSFFAEFSEPSWQYDWRNAAGETLLHFDFGCEPGSGWPVNATFHQPSLEARLVERVAQLPSVSVRRGSTVVAVRDAGESAEVDVEGRDGEVETVRSAYLVGCDGANSIVRSVIDPVVDDRGFFYDWAVVDVLPHDRSRVWEPQNLQLCDPARPTTAVSGGPGRRRFEFMVLPGEDPDDFDSDEVAWSLLERWGVSSENADMERSAVYRFRARCCRTWRAGRLLLAGDAAHLMPPFFGQGMCSGVRDAANLAWKLDVVLRGCAEESVLDTYTTERAAHVQHAIGMSVELGRVICLTDPVAVAARDATMLAAGGRPERALPPVPPPALGPGIARATQPASGPPFTSQGRVRGADGRVGLHDEIVGTGFVLSGPVDVRPFLGAEALDAFARLGGSLVQVVPRHVDPVDEGGLCQVADVDGHYLPLFAGAGIVAALVRPDFYLFGTAERPEDAASLLEDLLHQLGMPVLAGAGGGN